MNICHLLGAMPLSLVPKLEENDFLIAVDGGYHQAKSYDLEPSFAVGDFDSLGFVPEIPNLIQLPCEKDETDMEYALKMGLGLGFEHFFIQGGLGGRLDHSIANIHLLYSLIQKGKRGILVGDGQNILVMQEETLVFPHKLQGYLSIFPYQGLAEGIFLENLAYTGENLSLQPGAPLGVSNEFLPGKSAKITVNQGTLLVIWQGEWDFSIYKSLLGQKPPQKPEYQDWNHGF